MIYTHLKKRSSFLVVLILVLITIFSLCSLSQALDEVEEYVTASDGVQVPWGIKDGYEASDETGKNLDPIMYYGHKPDLAKATPLEIEKAWWYQIRGQYADNIYGGSGANVDGFDVGVNVTKTNKRGIHRDSATRRWLSNWPKTKGIDYKDCVMFLSPEDMRGIATLIWYYTDFSKDYDQWLWVPVLRKVRKIGAMEGEDSFGGMDIDYDDMSLRTPFQDTYKQIRVDVVDDTFIEEQRAIMTGFKSKDVDAIAGYFKNEAYGHKMWVLESSPIPKRMTYHKRIIWIEQNICRQVRSEWYDEAGRKVREVFRTWALSPFDNSDKKHTFEHNIFAGNHLTGHHTEMNVLKVTLNDPRNKPEIFTVRNLMRKRW